MCFEFGGQVPAFDGGCHVEASFEAEKELATPFLVGHGPGVGKGLAGLDLDPGGGALWQGSEAAALVNQGLEASAYSSSPPG
ncbi:hypothetical protein VM95_00810 [Streptomyces rubellomurinus]|uniref:Uncharacterized protein n=1 Tax=Streptomyces rubellomurinus (strain ATCC 31215) TaxID=359131 RepID=A0A0F2TMR8_STRR3|nr:hypothetical protein VM95_00810 [Streptomyces rubellomurinus]